MSATKKTQAADEFRIAQATMHRRARHFTNARRCIDSARYHLAQCGAILGLNPWPR